MDELKKTQGYKQGRGDRGEDSINNIERKYKGGARCRSCYCVCDNERSRSFLGLGRWEDIASVPLSEVKVRMIVI